jgi:hypothetical protein
VWKELDLEKNVVHTPCVPQPVYLSTNTSILFRDILDFMIRCSEVEVEGTGSVSHSGEKIQ